MARATQDDSLSILSVTFRNADLLVANQELTARLNTDAAIRWIVVDNSPDHPMPADLPLPTTVLPGVDVSTIPDRVGRASFHHGAALNKGLKAVDSRFVLVLDPDFFLVKNDWVRTLLRRMDEKDLSFFGSTWHPHYFTKYRYFPSVHCMLIDLSHVDTAHIDFSPESLGSSEKRMDALRRIKAPGWAINASAVGATRDTGYGLYRRFRRSRSALHETLVPYWRDPPPKAIQANKGSLGIRSRLLDGFSPVPLRPGSWTEQSFLRELSPLGWEAGWEEYWLDGEPFGVHLRSVGRVSGIDGEQQALVALLERISQGSL